MQSSTSAARLIALSAAGLAALATPAAQAQPRGGSLPSTLAERQALMRQITLQQQSVLETRSRCINQAKTLQELERCEKGYPTGMPGWHRSGGGAMGGWTCPMW